MHTFSSVAVLADLRGLEDDDAGRCSLRGGLVDDDEEDDALKSLSGMLVETTDAEESRRVRTRAAAEEHAAVATGRFMFLCTRSGSRSRPKSNPKMQPFGPWGFPLLTEHK